MYDIKITKPILNLFNECLTNVEFLNDLEKFDPDYKGNEPTKNMSDFKKVIYACVYEGWLIGRKEYDENKYR
jgi:hypothetical protein